MPWEAQTIPTGATVYVDDLPYVAVGARFRGVGTQACPPYIGITGQHPDGPVDPPGGVLLIEHNAGSPSGVPIWWLSHLRVTRDAPPVETEATRQVRVWKRQAGDGTV